MTDYLKFKPTDRTAVASPEVYRNLPQENPTNTYKTRNVVAKDGAKVQFFKGALNAEPTDEINYLLLSETSSALGKPLGLSSGGTGRNLSDVPDGAVIRKAGQGNNYLYYTPTVSGAMYATGENATPKFGTLPIAQGGTGADSPVAALGALYGLNLDFISHANYMIEEGDDINGYQIPGTYRCPTDEIRQTLDNAPPLDGGFRLIVSATSSAGGMIQVAIYNSILPQIYARTIKTGGTWSDWHRLMIDDDISKFGLGRSTCDKNLYSTPSALDQLHTAGWYEYYSSDAFACGYLGTLYGGVLVIPSMWATTQLFFCRDYHGGVLKRIHDSTEGEWSPWEWINPPMLVGHSYRTTERTAAGKSVYAKRLEYAITDTIGSLSGNTDFTIPHDISNFGTLVRATGIRGQFQLPTVNTSGGVASIHKVDSSNVTVRFYKYTINASTIAIDLYYTLN